MVGPLPTKEPCRRVKRTGSMSPDQMAPASSRHHVDAEHATSLAFGDRKLKGSHATAIEGRLHCLHYEALSLRFDAGISSGAGSRATVDPGVSPDRTSTGWLP
jgi:hypothetical protein